MKTDMHTASSLPLLAEYHATLQQHTGFYDEPSIDAKKASFLESHAGMVANDCADTIELLARLVAFRDPLAGDDKEIIDHMAGALRLVGSALRLANDMERTAGQARRHHETTARQPALTKE
ncbi:hypothetical protein [Craterilacuibacter sinensis]|uniref:Uncharacterized protein n=1 Tax=Craterilacuibacter sinensis TaxID=2686017 RepID=A0A845BUE9_9NEIS|nr:hypothetical protein [Craterilacuibacter sinensis]MXR38231.1 hypothetical protein [Craterilacuibacter sinensis]